MVRATQANIWSQTQVAGATGGGSGQSGGASPAGRPRHVGFLSQTQSRMLASPKGVGEAGLSRYPCGYTALKVQIMIEEALSRLPSMVLGEEGGWFGRPCISVASF